MRTRLATRVLLFRLGLVCLGTAILVLIISVSRMRQITGYLQQADAAVPWVQAGFLLSALATLLSLFGRNWSRIAAVSGSALFAAYWLFIALTLY